MTATTFTSQPIRKSVKSSISSSSKPIDQKKTGDTADQTNKNLMEEYYNNLNLMNELNKAADQNYSFLSHLSEAKSSSNNSKLNQDSSIYNDYVSCINCNDGEKDKNCIDKAFNNKNNFFLNNTKQSSPFKSAFNYSPFEKKENDKTTDYSFYSYYTPYDTANYDYSKQHQNSQKVNNNETSCPDASCDGGQNCNDNTSNQTANNAASCNDGCCNNASSTLNNTQPYDQKVYPTGKKDKSEVTATEENTDEEKPAEEADETKEESYTYYGYKDEYVKAFKKSLKLNSRSKSFINGKGQENNDDVACLNNSCDGGKDCTDKDKSYTYYGYNDKYKTTDKPLNEVNGRGQAYNDNKSNSQASSPFRRIFDNYSQFRERKDREVNGRGKGYQNEVTGYGNTYEVTGYNEQDGKIDHFRQGGIGDCWFLAGIDAISQDKDGAKIIQESIKKSASGGWDVTFKGQPGVTFHVSESEFQQYSGWSKGDPDVRILEIAGNKWRRRYKGRNLNAGDPAVAMRLLTGRNSERAHSRSQMIALLDKAADDPDGLSMTACCNWNNRAKGLVANHAYSVESVDKANRTVTLRNPWDNSKPFTISYDDFTRAMSQTTLEDEAPFNPDDLKPDNNDNDKDKDDKKDDKPDKLDLDKKFMLGLLNNMMQMFSQMMQMMKLFMEKNGVQEANPNPMDRIQEINLLT